MPKKEKLPESPKPEPVETSPKVSPEAEPVSAESLVEAVEMPPPNERTIEAIAADASENAVLPGIAGSEAPPPAPISSVPNLPPEGEQDSVGRKFKAEKMTGRKDGRGRWIYKSAQREAPPLENRPASYVGGQTAPAVAEDDFDRMAELYTRSGYAVAGMIFQAAEEWQPSSNDEHASLKKACAAYLRHKQCLDLPPGLALVIAVGTYAAPRFVLPKTKETVGKAVVWVKGAMKKDGPENVTSISAANAQS